MTCLLHPLREHAVPKLGDEEYERNSDADYCDCRANGAKQQNTYTWAHGLQRRRGNATDSVALKPAFGSQLAAVQQQLSRMQPSYASNITTGSGLPAQTTKQTIQHTVLISQREGGARKRPCPPAVAAEAAATANTLRTSGALPSPMHRSPIAPCTVCTRRCD